MLHPIVSRISAAVRAVSVDRVERAVDVRLHDDLDRVERPIAPHDEPEVR